jgi:hypothetical protein
VTSAAAADALDTLIQDPIQIARCCLNVGIVATPPGTTALTLIASGVPAVMAVAGSGGCHKRGKADRCPQVFYDGCAATGCP